MKRSRVNWSIGPAAAAALMLASTAAWAVSGAVGGGLGGTDPRGDFNRYSKTGFSLYGFGVLRGDQAPQVGLRLGVQYVAFEHDSRDVRVIGYPGALLKETYSNDLIKATVGIEFSPAMGTLEPYGGAGIGVYYFSSKTSLTTEYGEPIATRTLDSETRFGFNLNAGLRFFLTSTLAVDLGAHYDIVKDMEQYSEEETISVDSEFLSVLAGVSVTLPWKKETP